MEEKNNKFTFIIPARMAASRFPGKPLKKLDGKPVVGWVYDNCIKSKFCKEAIIATDSSEIVDYCKLKNKNYALKMLKAKLYQMEKEQINSKVQEIAGTKKDIGFGNQIRSYVLQPYQMIKDLRTGIETSNCQGVLDGDIDMFIESALAYKVINSN